MNRYLLSTSIGCAMCIAGVGILSQNMGATLIVGGVSVLFCTAAAAISNNSTP